MVVKRIIFPIFVSMDTRQKDRRDYKALPKGVYHLCTDGWKGGKLFHSRDQYVFGMATMALVATMFDIGIYAFVLMPNHIHLLIHASGETCMDVFNFFKRRTSSQLKQDGYTPLPENYWMKLKPIPDKKAMAREILYIARNAYEKDYCIPCAYPWSSCYLLFSQLAPYIRGQKVKDIPTIRLRELLGSAKKLPESWEIHPELGVLPINYVKTNAIKPLFGSAKNFMTRLVKEYETFVHISKELGEELEFSKNECEDIVYSKASTLFPGKLLKDLAHEEKGRLAVELERHYNFSMETIANCLRMNERTVRQFIVSKDYGYRKQ